MYLSHPFPAHFHPPLFDTHFCFCLIHLHTHPSIHTAQGKPYHISALYVVDLERFRRMKAGDLLRQVYDQLSADPNSLANLDQVCV
jgi:hypothetical protein